MCREPRYRRAGLVATRRKIHITSETNFSRNRPPQGLAPAQTYTAEDRLVPPHESRGGDALGSPRIWLRIVLNTRVRFSKHLDTAFTLVVTYSKP